ncbi:MAG: DUF1566 domain-containing protein [Bacteroidetes bacterium]|nr:DUF1566 domain-containing protein [Bacteroidota bacterium]
MNSKQLLILSAILLCTSTIASTAQHAFTKTMKRVAVTSPTAFIVDSDILTDTATSLMWQRTDGGEGTWAVAKQYCDTLTLGGFTDWRLPTAQELFSINDLALKNPALPTVFGVTSAEYWWSSDTLVGDGSRVWCTNAGGGIGPHPMKETIGAGGTKRFHVRAVRQTISAVAVPEHFTEATNETITDNATGLVWQQYCAEVPQTWANALQLADTLTQGGYNDWRLPNIKELQSLNMVMMRGPSVDIQYFPCVTSTNWLWTSTPMNGPGATQSWILQPELGIVTYAPKTELHTVLCVRGGDTTPTSVDDEQLSRSAAFYPNPTTGTLSLGFQAVSVRVVNLTGEEVLVTSVCSTIDMSGLAPGTYVVLTTDDLGTSRSSLVVKY